MAQPGLPESGNMVNFKPRSFNPFDGPGFLSNPMFQMAMSMYLPQMMGQGNFLPSLTPAQHLFDQYSAAKYQNARMRGLAGVQSIDQQALTGRILGLTGAMTDSPLTAMNVEQASNAAGIINNPLMKMFIGQMMGPENMEDLFYGSRGSAERLYQSVSNTGFFMRDPVSGQRTMSADSLSGMTREMYAQMYGPGADTSEMNGLSAGRAGALYEDLYRRGVLRHGLGNLSAADRARTVANNLPTDERTMDRLSREYAQQELMRGNEKFKIGDEEKTYAQLTPQQQQAQLESRLPEARTRLAREFKDIKDYNAGTGQKSVGEIEQLAGFGMAARSIDAQKVTTTLKQYSGAVAAVREIFGENGNGNAPFSQLVTALEALTQNQIGRVDPKKMEQFVREFQAAARNGGVGIQGQLAMSSQMGAITDALGIDRSFASNAALRGIQHGTALGDAGLLQGFGSMSPEEANLKAGQLEAASAASPVGLRLGAAFRVVKQDPKKHYNADGTAKTAVGAMVRAIENDQTTYVDPATGKTVDIQQGIRDQQSGFVMGVMKQSERADVINRVLMDRQGTAEFTAQVPAISRLAQRDTALGDMRAMTGGTLQNRNRDLDNDQLRELSDIVNEAVIDETTTDVAPEDRPVQMQRRIMREMVAAEEKRLESTIADPKARHDAAVKASRGTFTRTFGSTQPEVTATMMALEAQGNQMLSELGGVLGLDTQKTKVLLSNRGINAYEQNAAENKHEAERKSLFGGAQSNLLQKISDNIEFIGSDNPAVSAAAIARTTGVIPADRLEEAMRPGYESVARFAAQEDRKSKLTTSHELADLLKKSKSQDPTESAAARTELQKLAGDKGKEVTDPDKLYELANKRRVSEFAPGGKKHARHYADIMRGIGEGGEGGLTTATTAHAAALLDLSEDDAQTKKLAAALRTGDMEQIKPLLPERITSQEGLMGEIGKQTSFYAGMGKTGRGVNEQDAHAVADARLTTIRSYAKDDATKAAMMQTKEGRRLVAMGEADKSGAYTFDGERRNAFEDLGKTTTEDNDAFRTNMDKALAKDDKARAQWEKEKGGGITDPAQAATAAIQQVAAGAAGGLSGGISSATITIQRLEQMHINSATGLTLPAGATGRVTGSAESPAEITPATVAAALAQKQSKKLDGATADFNTALADLGALHAAAAKSGDFSLQDIISGKAQLPPELQTKADEILARANDAAHVINESVPQKPAEPAVPSTTTPPTPAAQTPATPAAQTPATAAQTSAEAAARATDNEATEQTPDAKERAPVAATPAPKPEVAADKLEKSVAEYRAAQDEIGLIADETGISREDLLSGKTADLSSEQKAAFFAAIGKGNAAGAAVFAASDGKQIMEALGGHPKLAQQIREYNADKTSSSAATPSTDAEHKDSTTAIDQAAQATAPAKDQPTDPVASSVPDDEDPFGEGAIDPQTLDPKTQTPITPPKKVKMGAYDTAYAEQYREHEEAEKVIRDPNSTPEEQARARVAIRKFENNEHQMRMQAVAAQMAEEQGIDTSDGVTVSGANGGVTVNGFELDSKEFYDRFRKYEETMDRVGELAQASNIGLRKGGENEYTTVAGVPTNINGRDVDPMAMTEDEIQAVIEETEHNARVNGGASADEAALLSKYQAALTDKKTQKEQKVRTAGEGRAAAVASAAKTTQQKEQKKKEETGVARGRVISDPEEKKALREEYAETVRSEEAEMAEEEDRDIKDMLGVSVEAAKSELRAFDVADASGIPWHEGKNQWHSVGGVPISINGKNVDPAALDIDELESVIAATSISGMMRGASTPEEDARLQTYRAALAKKKEEKTTDESSAAVETTADTATKRADEIDRAAQVTQQEQREEIARLQKAAGYTAEQTRAGADEKRTVVAKTQTDAQKKLGELDTAMRQSWSQLTASQKEEVRYLRRQEEYAKATAVLADPKATKEEKEKAQNFVQYTNTFHEGNRERDKIVGKQMAEEAGIDISREFKMQQTLGSLTINGQRLDHREHYRRSRAYDSGDSLTGVSDEALLHLERVREQEEQEDFVKQQSDTAIVAKEDERKTEQKQDADAKKETEKQRDVTLTVPTIEERDEKHAKTQIADATKQVQVAEAQRGTLYATNGFGSGGRSGGGEAQEINGVLQLRGLTEAFLAARGNQMDQTPDNGPPVDMAAASRAYAGAS